MKKTMNIKHFLVTRPEYQKTLFNKVVGKNGKTYYYNGNPLSVWVDGDGEGMSGRTVTYEMLSGDTDVVKGPWNTTTDDLLKNTGVDLTKNHWSIAFVLLDRKSALNFEKGLDEVVIGMTPDWIKGDFNEATEQMKNYIKYELELASNTSLEIVSVNGFGGVSIQTIWV